jgi:hypothetical protein
MMPRLGFAGFALSLASTIAWTGCQPSHDVPSGAPLLLSFTATAPDGTPLVFAGAVATGAASPLSHFLALFDRLLDPTQLSALDGDGGISPEGDIVRVTSTPAVDPLTVQATYTPNGFVPSLDPDAGTPLFGSALPEGPSLAVVPTAALPCGTTVSVALNPAKIRSHDQKVPFAPKDATVLTQLTFTTEPFTATLGLPQPPTTDGGADASDDADADDAGTAVSPGVPGDATATVTFNTLVGADAGDHITVTVTVGTEAVPGFGPAVVDPTNPSVWNVAPPSAAGWPAGATVTVTVDGDVADGYGTKLGSPVSGAFQVVN